MVVEPVDGELVLPANAVAGLQDARIQPATTETIVLTSPAKLMLAVNPDRVPEELRKDVVPSKDLELTTHSHFVPAELREPLRLLRRDGAKRGSLREAICWVPSLGAGP